MLRSKARQFVREDPLLKFPNVIWDSHYNGSFCALAYAFTFALTNSRTRRMASLMLGSLLA